MLTFKLQRLTVVTLVGLSFLCILPMVAAFDVRKSNNVETGTLHPLGSHYRIDSLRSLTLHLFYLIYQCLVQFCYVSYQPVQFLKDCWATYKEMHIFYQFIIGAPIFFIFAAATGLE